MDVSLIICTRDRWWQLARCLRSIQTIIFDRPWELILVDNGSTDDTAAISRQFAQVAAVPVFYVYEPRAGLGNAHNAGIGIARGEIIAFTDDDCYPAPDFLTQTWAAFQDPVLGYITGRIMLHDPADHPISINESVIPRTFPGGSFVRAGLLQGANMAFRRTVLRDIGGFDPLFGPGALFNAEDIDAAARASAMGWSGQYRPEVIVRHHHGRKAYDGPRVRRSYAIGRGAYHMKLLLSGEFVWFAQSVYEIPWSRLRCGTFLWEQFGAIKYACSVLARYFQSRFGHGLRRGI